MTLVGYARVSTTDQSLDIQLAKLAEAGCEKVFAERRTGTTTVGRAQFDAMMEYIREGDTLIVTKMDRLARSMRDLCNTVNALNDKEIGFRVLDQGGIDTTTPNGRLMLHLLGAFAEFETNLRKERQMEGIAKAKAAGAYTKGGRPKKDDSEIKRLVDLGKKPMEIVRETGISRSTVDRIRKELAKDTAFSPPLPA